MRYGFYHEFLEISKLNRLTDAKVFKQGFVRKRIGGKYNESKIRVWVKACCTCWKKRWTAISEEGIFYSSYPEDDITGVRDMLFFDRTIHIKFGYKLTGKKYGLTVYTTAKKFLFETMGKKEFFEF